jgi:hypothetical protein
MTHDDGACRVMDDLPNPALCDSRQVTSECAFVDDE